jgi:hypothetical protein
MKLIELLIAKANQQVLRTSRPPRLMYEAFALFADIGVSALFTALHCHAVSTDRRAAAVHGASVGVPEGYNSTIATQPFAGTACCQRHFGLADSR